MDRALLLLFLWALTGTVLLQTPGRTPSALDRDLDLVQVQRFLKAGKGIIIYSVSWGSAVTKQRNRLLQHYLGLKS